MIVCMPAWRADPALGQDCGPCFKTLTMKSRSQGAMSTSNERTERPAPSRSSSPPLRRRRLHDAAPPSNAAATAAAAGSGHTVGMDVAAGLELASWRTCAHPTDHPPLKQQSAMDGAVHAKTAQPHSEAMSREHGTGVHTNMPAQKAASTVPGEPVGAARSPCTPAQRAQAALSPSAGLSEPLSWVEAQAPHSSPLSAGALSSLMSAAVVSQSAVDHTCGMTTPVRARTGAS